MCGSKQSPVGQAKQPWRVSGGAERPRMGSAPARISSRVEPPHGHSQGGAGCSPNSSSKWFLSLSRGVGCSVLCHGLPAAVTAPRPRWDMVSVLPWGSWGHQDLWQQPELPRQPGGPGCCCFRGVVGSDGPWISQRRAGTGLWLQTWGAKAGGGKAGTTATDPLVPPAAGATEPSLFPEHPLP